MSPRDARSLGAGLAPARDARAVRPGERIHVLGAAGAGASAAALLARHAGADPDGCDPGGPSPYTPPLEESGIAVAWEHDPAHVRRDPRPDRLAVTKALTAVDPGHPELEAARSLGIAIEPWQQVVADAAVGRRLVGVAGTHGKSTTSGWLVHLLVAAGADPAAFVGALMPSSTTGGLPSTARWGRGDAFVVEADEYAGNFDAYRPEVAVLTNVEWDHPDAFADVDAVVDAFARWLATAGEGMAAGEGRAAGARRVASDPGRVASAAETVPAPASATPGSPTIVANVADPGVARVLDRLAVAGTPHRLVAAALVDRPAAELGILAEEIAGRHPAARPGSAAAPANGVAAPRILVGRIAGESPAATDLEILGLGPGGERRLVRLPTAGRHNAANALAVAGAAVALGIAPEAIVRGLASFPGIGRRLERKGEVAGVVVYDDYAHHPTAIRETLRAVRQREPGRRVWAVYEPLTHHRTAAFLPAFAEVLAEADAVAIADIWAGRDTEADVAAVSAADLAEAVARRRPGAMVEAPGSPEATATRLATRVRAGDVVLVMGGGHSYRIGERLLAALRARR